MDHLEPLCRVQIVGDVAPVTPLNARRRPWSSSSLRVKPARQWPQTSVRASEPMTLNTSCTSTGLGVQAPCPRRSRGPDSSPLDLEQISVCFKADRVGGRRGGHRSGSGRAGVGRAEIPKQRMTLVGPGKPTARQRRRPRIPLGFSALEAARCRVTDGWFVTARPAWAVHRPTSGGD